MNRKNLQKFIHEFAELSDASLIRKKNGAIEQEKFFSRAVQDAQKELQQFGEKATELKIKVLKSRQSYWGQRVAAYSEVLAWRERND